MRICEARSADGEDEAVLGLKRRQSAVLPVVALTALGALFLFPDAFALSDWMAGAAEWVSLAMGFLAPAVLLAVAALRRR